ncbi:MAG: GSCFA domain-containing protein [Algicola sp.]|nr:GSCFA domain-containing protein [Algicola sp.]
MKFRKITFQGQEALDEIVEEIEDQTYHLVPDHHYGLHSLIEKQNRFAELNQVSQESFERSFNIRESDFTRNGFTRLKNVIPRDLCEYFIKQSKENPDAIKHPDVMNSLLPVILKSEIDEQLCSFFGSEYTLFWYSYLTTEPGLENRSHSSYWHCDRGPEKHLKMLIYLNDYDEHLGNTKFLDKTTSDKLKKVGYIFGDINARSDDLGPLARAKGIDINETMYDDIKAGDALLFAPNQIAHIGKIPETTARHVLQLCFLPSPFPWLYTKTNVYYSKTEATPFEGVAEQILRFVEDKPKRFGERVAVPADGAITTPEQLKWLMHNMYADEKFADIMFERLMELDPNLEELSTLGSLLETLSMSFKGSIDWHGDLGIENIRNLEQLAQFQEEYRDAVTRYSVTGKPKPEAIFWPMPDHASRPASKFDTIPFVKHHPIMNMDTPIGSAGSCFAFEIAHVFQEMGYNYVVTERNDDPASGITVDGYTPGDKSAKFCANYGILFNTPSFKQLAERAFGVRPTKQILFQQPDRDWVDPYRENVTFTSQEAYYTDYDRHIEATRTALEQVEVFIVTLGLNECWSFRDGTVMSRNPRNNMFPFVKHQTLTVQQNVDNIQAFFDIVKKHNPKFKLIISVSPIPFLATGRAEDTHVISANCHSKSVLRVAAEQLVQSNQDMYYLPSYELVMECIEDAWEVDTRHVKRSTVEQVVAMFKQIFIQA